VFHQYLEKKQKGIDYSPDSTSDIDRQVASISYARWVDTGDLLASITEPMAVSIKRQQVRMKEQKMLAQFCSSLH